MRLRSDGLSWRRTGDEIVVLDLSGSEYFSLNASAALLWERLAEGDQEPRELVDGLLSAYGIERTQAESDVAAFIALLHRSGLVQP